MKKLYEVSADLILYVMVEDEREAEIIGKSQLYEEMDNADINAYKADSILAIWSDSVPYGSDDNRTCGEIIAEQREIEKKIIEQKEYEKLHPQGEIFEKIGD